jgi:hypothetical protein
LKGSLFSQVSGWNSWFPKGCKECLEKDGNISNISIGEHFLLLEPFPALLLNVKFRSGGARPNDISSIKIKLPQRLVEHHAKNDYAAKRTYSSTHSYPRHWIQLHASPALPQRKEPPVPTGFVAARKFPKCGGNQLSAEGGKGVHLLVF